MFALEGVVGAWVGSAALLAGAATLLVQASALGFAAAGERLPVQDRRLLDLVLGVTLSAVVLAAVGEILRRLSLGGAPDASALAWTASLALAANLFCAARMMRFQVGPRGINTLWALARRDIIPDLLVLAAAGLIAVSRSRWPDILAGALIGGLTFQTTREILRATWRAVTGRS